MHTAFPSWDVKDPPTLATHAGYSPAESQAANTVSLASETAARAIIHLVSSWPTTAGTIG